MEKASATPPIICERIKYNIIFYAIIPYYQKKLKGLRFDLSSFLLSHKKLVHLLEILLQKHQELLLYKPDE